MRACGPAAPINSPTLARLIESGRPHRLHHTCGATRCQRVRELYFSNNDLYQNKTTRSILHTAVVNTYNSLLHPTNLYKRITFITMKISETKRKNSPAVLSAMDVAILK